MLSDYAVITLVSRLLAQVEIIESGKHTIYAIESLNYSKRLPYMLGKELALNMVEAELMSMVRS
jgi:hypothetical protein